MSVTTIGWRAFEHSPINSLTLTSVLRGLDALRGGVGIGLAFLSSNDTDNDLANFTTAPLSITDTAKERVGVVELIYGTAGLVTLLAVVVYYCCFKKVYLEEGVHRADKKEKHGVSTIASRILAWVNDSRNSPSDVAEKLEKEVDVPQVIRMEAGKWVEENTNFALCVRNEVTNEPPSEVLARCQQRCGLSNEEVADLDVLCQTSPILSSDCNKAQHVFAMSGVQFSVPEYTTLSQLYNLVNALKLPDVRITAEDIRTAAGLAQQPHEEAFDSYDDVAAYVEGQVMEGFEREMGESKSNVGPSHQVRDCWLAVAKHMGESIRRYKQEAGAARPRMPIAEAIEHISRMKTSLDKAHYALYKVWEDAMTALVAHSTRRRTSDELKRQLEAWSSAAKPCVTTSTILLYNGREENNDSISPDAAYGQHLIDQMSKQYFVPTMIQNRIQRLTRERSSCWRCCCRPRVRGRHDAARVISNYFHGYKGAEVPLSRSDMCHLVFTSFFTHKHTLRLFSFAFSLVGGALFVADKELVTAAVFIAASFFFSRLDVRKNNDSEKNTGVTPVPTSAASTGSPDAPASAETGHVEVPVISRV